MLTPTPRRISDHRRQGNQISDTIVDQQQNLDAALVSVIGLAEIGNEVLGENRQPLTDVLHLLVPTTDLTNEYNQALWCGLAGMVNASGRPPLKRAGRRGVGRVPLGPAELPLPAGSAQGGRRRRTPVHRAAEHALKGSSAVRRHRHRSQPVAHANPGIVLNADVTQTVHVRRTEIRRPAAQQRADRTAGMRRSLRSTLVKFGVFAVVMALLTGVLVLYLRSVPNRLDGGLFGCIRRRLATRDRRSVRVAGMRVGTVNSVSSAGQDGARHVRRGPRYRAHHRHSGRGALSQPRR